jgi:hypothetical protein
MRKHRGRARCVTKGARRVRRGASGNLWGSHPGGAGCLLSKHMPNLHVAMLLALCLLSAGCVVSIPSEPGAENVTMTHKEADVASCTVLGNVEGLTDTNYVRDERREMQNQVVGLGGDTLLLARDRDPPTGTAYRCKPSVTENH